jgi:hypothetical protein
LPPAIAVTILKKSEMIIGPVFWRGKCLTGHIITIKIIRFCGYIGVTLLAYP